jgi:hypothetical protein
VCGGETEQRAVSPLENVAARYCKDCTAAAHAIESAVPCGPITEQSVFQLDAVVRLRRIEAVAHDLVGRRLQAARRMGAKWDELCDAVGLANADLVQRTYPLRDTPSDSWGWGA